LSGQIPLPVAQLGGSLTAPGGCNALRNLGLFMPDMPSYRAADVDGDGLICFIELGGDSDGDGIPDAQDPDLLAAVLETVPDEAFGSGGGGHRTATQAILEALEAEIARGDFDDAVRGLRLLRTHFDGCGATADSDDWIMECSTQLHVRNWIDTLITNLGG